MRSSWDEYFMMLAEDVSTRATCDRKHVGCILVKDKRVISTGFNGSLPGLPHCDDIGHLMIAGHCKRTVHAEANAVTLAAKHGISVDGATAYINTFPCDNCFKILVAAGIKRIVYNDMYTHTTDDLAFSLAKELGIELEQVRKEKDVPSLS